MVMLSLPATAAAEYIMSEVENTQKAHILDKPGKIPIVQTINIVLGLFRTTANQKRRGKEN